MVSLPNKINQAYQKLDQRINVPSFERSVVYSFVFHGLLVGVMLLFSKFNTTSWKKAPPISSVVWTQTVKRKQLTIPDKLPPPLVPLKKAEPEKIQEINIKKPPAPIPLKPPEETREEKMKKALEKLKQNVKDDDRPTPKADNFATADPKKPEGILSDTEILAIQSSSVYSAYAAQVKQTVQSNFIWYKSGDKFVTKVTVKIDAQGNISGAKVDESSGDFSYDQATLRAIQKSNPLPPPPDELKVLIAQDGLPFNFDRTKQ